MIKDMIDAPESFEAFFENGMGRELSFPFTDTSGYVVNLGAGNSPIPNAVNLDLPGWEGGIDPIPLEDGTATVVHAYHFLEHLDWYNAVQVLREVERVLAPDGLFYVVVPYARADIAFQDITHRTFWTEESWKTLLDNQHYRPTEGEIKLKVIYNLIAGVAGRNLSIFTILKKYTEED